MPSVSVAQQHFMGMVHAAQKGSLKNPSPAVAKAAKSMSRQDATDFASTKHKGLPQHKEASFVEKLAMMDMMPQMHQHQSVPDPYAQPMFGTDLAAHIEDPLQRQNFILAMLQNNDAGGMQPGGMPGMPQGDEQEELNQQAPGDLGTAQMKMAGSILNPASREASKPNVVTKIPSLMPQPQAPAQKMVMQPAPAVPNPIVPRSQSAMPMPGAKQAGCCTMKPAPRHTMSGKKGKKAMPQPHARQLKHASFMEELALGN